jgi:hypothetical protein
VFANGGGWEEEYQFAAMMGLWRIFFFDFGFWRFFGIEERFFFF